MAQGDIWLLTVRGFLNLNDHIHTLHFRENGAETTGEQLIAAWEGVPKTSYRALFSADQACLQEITARKVAPLVGAPSPAVTTYPIGTGLGSTAKGNNQWSASFLAALVTEKGELSGRRYSGRFFMGGLYEDDLYYNSLEPQYVARLQTYCNDLKAAFVTPGEPTWRLFAFSPLLAYGDPEHTRRDPAPPHGRIPDPVDAVAPALAGSDVRELVINPLVTTMRSRKTGHGN